MRIVLSHPYSTALFFWFAEMERSSVTDPKIRHPYYRALFRESRHLVDVAIGALVVFDEVVIPAVDAPFPNRGFSGDGQLPGLGLRADWEPVHEARSILDVHRALIESDPVVTELLAGLPGDERELEVHYALADVLFADHYGAPLVCAVGRSLLSERLCHLGVFGGLLKSTALDAALQLASGRDIHSGLQGYQEIIGFTFKRENIERIESVKADQVIADYASEFQKVLGGISAGDGALVDAMAVALEKGTFRRSLSGGFSTASRVASLLSLAPGVGTVFGIGALVSDATSVHAGRLARRASWFELSTEIHRHQTLESLTAAVHVRATRS